MAQGGQFSVARDNGTDGANILAKVTILRPCGAGRVGRVSQKAKVKTAEVESCRWESGTREDAEGRPAALAALECGSGAAAFRDTGQGKAGAALPQSKDRRPRAVGGHRSQARMA